MDVAAVLEGAEEADLRLVRFLWCGNDGIVRGKGSGVRRPRGPARDRRRPHRGLQAINALDQLQPIEGMGPVGEVRLIPDLDTFVVLPYAPRSGAHAHRPLRSRR